MLTKIDIGHDHAETWLLSLSVAISVYMHVLGFESGHQLIDQLFTKPLSKCCDKDRLTATYIIMYPKILKIMPVDAYNASIILKCLHTSIMLKIIMPA